MIETLWAEIFLNNTILLKTGLAWVICIFFWIGISESIFRHIVKNNKRRGDLLSTTVGLKLLTLVLSLMIVIAGGILIALIILLIECVIMYYLIFLVIIGVIAIIGVYFWTNGMYVKKHMKKPKHTHKFRKGNKIKCLPKYDGYIAISGIRNPLSSDFSYKFVKNSDLDSIWIECVDTRSEWKGETRRFRDYYFKKVK